MQTNFEGEANLKIISFPILQRRVGPVLSSVFQNANTHLSKIFYCNISKCQSITTTTQIFHFCLHALYLLALLFKRARRQHLDLQILQILVYSNLSKKLSHAAMIYFHYFGIFLVQSKHKHIKTTLSSVMLSSCYANLNRRN